MTRVVELVITLLILIFCQKCSSIVEIVCFNNDTSPLCEVRRLISLYDHEEASRPVGWTRNEIRPPTKPTTLSPPINKTTNSTKPPETTPEPFVFLPKTHLVISHCNVTHLPFRMGIVFPYLNALIVWYSGLSELFVDSLNDCANLFEINFENNEIERIHENTFDSNKGLNYLNLGFNKIRVLPNSLLSKLKRLEKFIANSNRIEVLSRDIFTNNSNLIFVNLNNNRIKTIEFDFKTSNIRKLLGLGNVCDNFFINKKVDKIQLDKQVKQSCPEIKLTTVADD